ncbi:MAG: hypothetical protein K6G15_06865 [Desulfovibrio sp.]|nr:hypothetical protein [Desulfovibrio sp.]
MNVVTKDEVLQNSTSFADCLKYMMTARREGKVLDFTFWKADIKSLLEMDSKNIDFLLSMYREFHSAMCQQGLRKASLSRKKRMLEQE